MTFNQNIFCQTLTPTTTPTPNPSATCARPTPGTCVWYEAESDNNTLTGSAFILSCPTCSGGLKVGYVGSNDGTLQFNAVGVVATGNYTVTICYLNGDAVRYALLSVNGGPGTPPSQQDNVCYIGNIYGANVDNFAGVARIVYVDPDGRLGTIPIGTPTPSPTPVPTATPGSGNPVKSSPKGVQPQAIPDTARQPKLTLEVQSLEAMVSQQQNQIEILTAQIKEQMAQIQKVNTRLEMKKPEAKTIVNKPQAVP